MTESTNVISENSLSLGQQLKKARESLGLSLDDVVQKTNLKKNHLESLENDIFILQNVAPAFVRGYVRNYVRFLRLPEDLVSTVNYGEVTIPKEVQKAAASAKVAQQSQKRWLKCGSVLVLLGIIGMTGAWWWQEYKKDQESREVLVSETTAEQTATNTPAANTVEIQPQPVATESSVAVQPVQAEPQPVQEPPKAEPTAPVVNNVTDLAAIQANQAQPQAEQAVQTAENALQQPTEATAEQPAAANNDELRIEITNAQSWITVRGDKKKRLAEKLYNSGEVLSFNGNQQYSLTIGAPANVKLYYKGQQVPLKIDGRVARIKLPQ
ncbi:helix-turn-helix domain-containing protein [Haemophilus paracuniculus]|uniref:Helix-turn-helix domain-containing protein n=1 Tax=Haemophilus paracuniculus TaxID=734 RepID=A0A1T0APX1_9PAST|nr:RodZ domain-containing protein [Haemophilus paracuniculus]OOR98130.1 helix-turn-helix domain-containing protein [Haemophilus paracuniculus]